MFHYLLYASYIPSWESQQNKTNNLICFMVCLNHEITVFLTPCLRFWLLDDPTISNSSLSYYSWLPLPPTVGNLGILDFSWAHYHCHFIGFKPQMGSNCRCWSSSTHSPYSHWTPNSYLYSTCPPYLLINAFGLQTFPWLCSLWYWITHEFLAVDTLINFDTWCKNLKVVFCCFCNYIFVVNDMTSLIHTWRR